MTKALRRIRTGVGILRESFATASLARKVFSAVSAFVAWTWPVAALRWDSLYLQGVPEPYRPLVPWAVALGATIVWAIWMLLGKIESLEDGEQDMLRPGFRITRQRGGSFVWTNGTARLQRVLVENISGKPLTGVAVQLTKTEGRETADLPLDLWRMNRGPEHRHDFLQGELSYFDVIEDDRPNDNAMVHCVMQSLLARWPLGSLARYRLRIEVIPPSGPTVGQWLKVGRDDEGYHTLEAE